MFGLPDYYDVDTHDEGSPNYTNANLTGSYTMQEQDKVSHDPFSLIALGWQKPYVISNDCTIELNKGEVALVSPDGLASNSPFDEYMLVDLWSYGGTDMININDDAFFSGIKPGVRIWHVDSRLDGYGNIIASNNFTTKYNQLMLMRADAAFDEDAYEAKHAEMNGTLYYEDTQTGETKCTFNYNKYSKEMTDANLFKAGESFSAAKYPKAFFTDGAFDNGQSFDWIITVVSVNKDRAIVNFRRA